ncbi:MAG: beta-ketoacyl-[acyl-carrier-protein] synthase family protein [Bacteroidales bacterium]|nr:beta-ketoacyl-[acyl-carrier-protein] synthase family protein [Bacteroidales bacterium]MCF8458651.1 beta-ketoacyl-[acyl-carrier-protein] synthase family protein [Bacteroidales bacterium]
MSERVFVTGIGTISAIGNDIESTFHSLLDSKSGVGPIRHLKTKHSNDFVAGEVNHSNEELRMMAGLSEDFICTRTALLGIIAAREAVKNAGLSNLDMETTGLISATTIGGMDKSEIHYHDYIQGDNLEYAKTHPCGDNTEKIAEALGITGFSTTISTACSSSANAIMFGARMIKSGQLDRVVVGGTDALSKFTLNGFNSLMILDKEPCKPFDENRKGLNLGEGAAYLVLESANAIDLTGKTPLCEVTGYANANDAFHQTASSPTGEGPFLSMKRALEKAGLSPGDISYINAHGTGTDNNDMTEGLAIQRLFGEYVPKFSSTKAFTGHTLGAAGAIEAIISILAIMNGFVPPSLNIKTPVSDHYIRPQKEALLNQVIEHVLSNSFGFGGNDSSLLFSKLRK